MYTMTTSHPTSQTYRNCLLYLHLLLMIATNSTSTMISLNGGICFVAAAAAAATAADDEDDDESKKKIASKRKRWKSRSSRKDGANSPISYWKEILDQNTGLSTTSRSLHYGCVVRNTNENENKGRHKLHFGRMQLCTANDDDDENSISLTENGDTKNCQGGTTDHPLRTELWEMNIEWFNLLMVMMPKKSKNTLTMQTRTKSRNKITLELNSEGYCRIIEVQKNKADSLSRGRKRSTHKTNQPAATGALVDITSSSSSRYKNIKIKRTCSKKENGEEESDDEHLSVLGMGKWIKRPYGISIHVRPVVTTTAPGTDLNFDKRKANTELATQLNTRNTIINIDESVEYIFHARDFHWNGFGSNCPPRLTRGTILLQTKKKTHQIFRKFFRPVVGTFSANGIL